MRAGSHAPPQIGHLDEPSFLGRYLAVTHFASSLAGLLRFLREDHRNYVVAVLLHLSDIHLGAGTPEQPRVLAALADAIREDRTRRGRKVDLVLISGDVFESADMDPEQGAAQLAVLRSAVTAALGEDHPPWVIVPGNHDRRVSGLIGPGRSELFDHVAETSPGHVYVHGGDGPFLARVVPHRFHGQPFHLISYDSTWLPRGLLGAGGTMRPEDLYQVAAEVGDEHPDWPIVFLVHHHLVPTAVTDIDTIPADGRPPVIRWAIKELLPRLVAHADREEWMMAALGAGTALSTLHALGRAVLVLHGHKHNATARALDATREGEGDLLLVSAGSAGTARNAENDTRHAARIWPSFNIIELDRESVSVEAVAFGWKGRSRGVLDPQPLVFAAKKDSQWKVAPMPATREPVGPRLLLDAGRFKLHPAVDPGRWDVSVERRIEPDPDARLPHYIVAVDALPEARIYDASGRLSLPGEIHLRPYDTVNWREESGALRTFDAARELESDMASPFGKIAMLVRYATARARVVLEGDTRLLATAFASVTDVGSGLARPVPIRRIGKRAVVELSPCAARTMITIHWPLEGTGATQRVRNGVDARRPPRRVELGFPDDVALDEVPRARAPRASAE